MDVYAFHLMPYPAGEDPVAWPITGDRYDPEIGIDLYERYLAQLVYAETLGFDGVACNEHHYRAFGLMPAPNIIATALAARTDEVDIALYGNILPLRDNPVRLAEELAMVDNLSEGRLVSGFVRGLPQEYEAYGIDQDESRDRFNEAWDLIVSAWTEPDPFEFRGEYYEYEDVFIWPRPVQDPHPPLRRPAVSEASIRHTVDHRVPTSRVFCPTDAMADSFAQYRELAEAAGWTPGDEYFEACRLVYVGESMEAAREEAEEHVEYLYRTLLISSFRTAAVFEAGDTAYDPERAHVYEEIVEEMLDPFGDQWARADFDELQASGEIIVGDPTYVSEELERQYDRIGGFGTLINLFQFGSLPDHLARANLERFADEVMPEIARL